MVIMSLSSVLLVSSTLLRWSHLAEDFSAVCTGDVTIPQEGTNGGEMKSFRQNVRARSDVGGTGIWEADDVVRQCPIRL